MRWIDQIPRTYLIDGCRSKTVANAGKPVQPTEKFLPVAKERKRRSGNVNQLNRNVVGI